MERRGVLVTGAGSGIGAATARELVARGFLVYAGVRRDEDGMRLAAELGPRLVPLRLDVTRAEEIEAAIAAIAADERGDGGLYGLVNNAGFVLAGPLEALAIDDVRAQFETNVIGALAVTRAALPLLRRSLGRIVMVGSIAGRVALPFGAPYAASKHALRAFAEALRVELGPWELGVTLVEPGAIATPLWARSRALAEARFAGVDAVARARYEPAMRSLVRLAGRAERGAIPSERVAQVIARALIARRAPANVLVGNDVLPQLVLAALPSRLRAFLVGRLVAATAR